MDLGKDNTASNTGSYQKMDLLPWSIVKIIVTLGQRSRLDFAPFCMAMVTLPRSWQERSKASEELAMDLGKGIMASNTGHKPQVRYMQDRSKCPKCSGWFRQRQPLE